MAEGTTSVKNTRVPNQRHQRRDVRAAKQCHDYFGNCSTALEHRCAGYDCMDGLIGIGAMSRGCADNGSDSGEQIGAPV
jgi:hypothetical protein